MGEHKYQADYDPYVLATMYMPPIEGGHYVTMTPAGPTSLYITERDILNPIFEPGVDLASIPGLLVNADQQQPAADSASGSDEQEEESDEEDEDEEDTDVDSEEMDEEFRTLTGESAFDAGDDAQSSYSEDNPFGFLIGRDRRVDTISMSGFVPFTTVSRATLPTVCGLNGNVRFAAWHNSVRQVLPHTKELERYLFAPVAELRHGKMAASFGKEDNSSLLFPPGLYIIAGDSGVGKTTMITQALPKLIGPAGRWLRDPLILKHRNLLSYVGFGEPVMFARDGNDWAGLCLDLSIALTKCPIAVVDSLKMAQIVGTGPAKEGGFFRWVYALLQSLARLAQYNGLIIFVVMHYFGIKPGSDEMKRLWAELDAVSSGYFSIDEFQADTKTYKGTGKVRVPVALGSRKAREYIIPASDPMLERVATAWSDAIEREYERQKRKKT
jgi:hypothetical protein